VIRLAVLSTLLLAAAQAAHAADLADPAVGFRIDVPTDWKTSEELTKVVVADLVARDRYGGAPLRSNGRVYADPDQGVALYVLWTTTESEVAAAGDRISAALEDKANRPDAANVVKSIDVGPRAAVAVVELDTPKNETHTRLRAVAFVDAAGRVHEVVAECVTRSDAPAELVDRCARSVASLEITIPEGERKHLEVTRAVAGVTGGEAEAGAASAPGLPAERLQMVVEQRKRSRAWLWIALGGGVVVVAIAVAMRSKKTKKNET
jgi:hypothetical protein